MADSQKVPLFPIRAPHISDLKLYLPGGPWRQFLGASGLHLEIQENRHILITITCRLMSGCCGVHETCVPLPIFDEEQRHKLAERPFRGPTAAPAGHAISYSVFRWGPQSSILWAVSLRPLLYIRHGSQKGLI